MVVFLKTSEEATCKETTNNCAYTWTSTLPTVTGFNISFDETNYVWAFTVNGTGFTGDTTTVELYIGGRKQTTSAVSSTQLTIQVTNVTSAALVPTLYFPEGIPENHTAVAQTFNMTPKYVSISPNAGSIGGSLLNVTIPGVGLNSTVDILASNGSSICANNATVTSYGVVSCKSNPGEMTSDALSI
jgi:hypothetical protein